MISIERLFQLIFADSQISRAELRLFTEDHLAKLRAQNMSGPFAGQFVSLITATETAFNRFIDTLSAEDSAGAERQGDTITKDAALESFIALVRRRETRIKDRLGKPSAGYEEFFPHGLTEYGKPTMAQAPVLMDRMVLKATKYSAQVGAELITEFTNARSAFVEARSAQVDQKGDVSEIVEERRMARTAVEVQLQKNFLTIALLNVGHPEVVKDYCDQSLLKNPVHAPATPAPVDPAT